MSERSEDFTAGAGGHPRHGMSERSEDFTAGAGGHPRHGMSEDLSVLPKPVNLSEADLDVLLHRARSIPEEVMARVQEILEDVRERGDRALREWTKRLDGIDLADPWFADDAWDAAAAACPDDVHAAMQGDLGRIEAFHRIQVGKEDRVETAPGLVLGRRPIPMRRVACYVPGGRASYPSTVLMTVTPARLAGVEDIIVVTPPRKDGGIDPAVAAAARLAGATRILRAGGAQAVAALAFGTENVPPVDAIVGPGNAYVTAAKAAVGDRVRTDAPAGPSELLVLASGKADPDRIVWDLLAQAEHAPDAQVILVTPDTDLADAVAGRLPAAVAAARRTDIVAASLRDHGRILVSDDLDAAVAFVDAYAPEHLTIMTPEPHAVLDRIHNAGSVFLGPDTPVSLGDYGSGTNHVLPTMGHARLHGGLSVDHFRKWLTWQEATPEGLAAVAHDVARLARAEGLVGHAEAVERRLRRPPGGTH